ncbi:MAG: prepilin-type N-terminal cleavage/methylation domain-containing protein [Oscillospiraceae bacterium]|nr:prepilin-type N-terminal cleavage/methylation domain-containing protein [Oscillospiraceae bacterium]
MKTNMKTKSLLKRLKSKRGMTLIEVIIAVVIFTMITAAAFSMYQPISEIAGSVRTDNDMQRIVTASENYIARQLRNAVEIKVIKADAWTDAAVDMANFTVGRTAAGDDPRALIIEESSTIGTRIYDVRLNDVGGPIPADIEKFRVFNTSFYSDILLDIGIDLSENDPALQERDRTFLELTTTAKRDAKFGMKSSALAAERTDKKVGGYNGEASILLSWIGYVDGSDKNAFTDTARTLNKASITGAGNTWIILYHNNIDMDRKQPDVFVPDKKCPTCKHHTVGAPGGSTCDLSTCPETLPCWSPNCLDICVAVCNVGSGIMHAKDDPAKPLDCYFDGCPNCLADPGDPEYGLPCYPYCGYGCQLPDKPTYANGVFGRGCGDVYPATPCNSELCCECGDTFNCDVCRYRCPKCKKQMTVEIIGGSEVVICRKCCKFCGEPPHLGHLPGCQVSCSGTHTETVTTPATCYSEGVLTVTCTIPSCAANGTVVIEKLPHKFSGHYYKNPDDVSSHIRYCENYFDHDCKGLEIESHEWTYTEGGKVCNKCGESDNDIYALISTCTCILPEPAVNDEGDEEPADKSHLCPRTVTIVNESGADSANWRTPDVDINESGNVKLVEVEGEEKSSVSVKRGDDDKIVGTFSVFPTIGKGTDKFGFSGTILIQNNSSEEFYIVIDVLNCTHEWGAYKPVSDPTCEKKYTTERVCKICGFKERREEGEPLGHKFIAVVKSDEPENPRVEVEKIDGDASLFDAEEFNGWIKTFNATCTLASRYERVCVREECLKAFTKEGTKEGTVALGHKFDDEVESLSTVIRCWGGFKYFSCSNAGCNAPPNQVTVEPELPEYDEGDEDLRNETGEPTCTTPGGFEYLCKHCEGKDDVGAPLSSHRKPGDTEIPPLGHDWLPWKTKENGEVSCLSDEILIRTCNRGGCSESQNSTQPPEDGFEGEQPVFATKTGHGICPAFTEENIKNEPGYWNVTGTEGNCGDPVTYTWVCPLCNGDDVGEDEAGNKEKYENEITAEHNWILTEWFKLDDEYHMRKCSACQQLVETADNPKIAHGNWVSVDTTDATCYAVGEILYNCGSECGATMTEEIPKIAHTWGDYTSVGDGGHAKKCTVSACGAMDDEVLAHVFPDDWSPDSANCFKKCDDCEYITTQSHTYSSMWIPIITGGISTTCGKTCDSCGNVLTQAHKFGDWLDGVRYCGNASIPTTEGCGYEDENTEPCKPLPAPSFSVELLARANNPNWVDRKGNTVEITGNGTYTSTITGVSDTGYRSIIIASSGISPDTILVGTSIAAPDVYHDSNVVITVNSVTVNGTARAHTFPANSRFIRIQPGNGLDKRALAVLWYDQWYDGGPTHGGNQPATFWQRMGGAMSGTTTSISVTFTISGVAQEETHDFTSGIWDVDALDNQHRQKCRKCPAYSAWEAHTFTGAWVPNPGECRERQFCKCGAHTERAKDHTYGSWSDIDGECKQECTCTVCGIKDYQDVAHSFGDWVVTTPADCTTNGVETETCDNCGEANTRPISALGHLRTKDNWTSTNDEGSIRTKICGRDGCDTLLTCAPSASGSGVTQVRFAHDGNPCGYCGYLLEKCGRCGCRTCYGEPYGRIPGCEDEDGTDCTAGGAGGCGNHSYPAWAAVNTGDFLPNGQQARKCNNCNNYEFQDAFTVTLQTGNVTRDNAMVTVTFTIRNNSGSNIEGRRLVLDVELLPTDIGTITNVDGGSIGASRSGNKSLIRKGGGDTLNNNATRTIDARFTFSSNANATNFVNAYNAATDKTSVIAIYGLRVTQAGQDGALVWETHDWEKYSGITPPTYCRTKFEADGKIDCCEIGVQEHTYGAFSPVSSRHERSCTRTGCTAKDSHAISWNWTVVTEPTCTTAGSRTATCSVTGCTETETGTIAILPHTWGDWTTVTAATCTTTGTQTRPCTRAGCTETETGTITALGHQRTAGGWDGDGDTRTKQCGRAGCTTTLTCAPSASGSGVTQTQFAHNNNPCTFCEYAAALSATATFAQVDQGQLITITNTGAAAITSWTLTVNRTNGDWCNLHMNAMWSNINNTVTLIGGGTSTFVITNNTGQHQIAPGGTVVIYLQNGNISNVSVIVS